VVMADRDAAGLAAAIASLGGAGLRASSTVVDMTDAAAVLKLIDGAVARHGRLDYLFNNAGIGVVAMPGTFRSKTGAQSSTRTSSARSMAWRCLPRHGKAGLRTHREHASLAGLVPSPERYPTRQASMLSWDSRIAPHRGQGPGREGERRLPGLDRHAVPPEHQGDRDRQQQLLQILPGSWRRSTAPGRFCAAWSEQADHPRHLPGLVVLVDQPDQPGLMRWIWLRFTRKVRKLRKNV